MQPFGTMLVTEFILTAGSSVRAESGRNEDSCGVIFIDSSVLII